MAFEEGTMKDDDAVLLQTYLGIATSVGSLTYGLIVLSKNHQCMISRQYLLQSSIFGIGEKETMFIHSRKNKTIIKIFAITVTS